MSTSPAPLVSGVDPSGGAQTGAQSAGSIDAQAVGTVANRFTALGKSDISILRITHGTVAGDPFEVGETVAYTPVDERAPRDIPALVDFDENPQDMGASIRSSGRITVATKNSFSDGYVLKLLSEDEGDEEFRWDIFKFGDNFCPTGWVEPGNPGDGALTIATFTDESAGNPFEWLWEFRDGETSTEQNPTHEYDTPGEYAVALTAKNHAGELGRHRLVKTGIISVGCIWNDFFTGNDGDLLNPLLWEDAVGNLKIKGNKASSLSGQFAVWSQCWLGPVFDVQVNVDVSPDGVFADAGLAISDEDGDNWYHLELFVYEDDAINVSFDTYLQTGTTHVSHAAWTSGSVTLRFVRDLAGLHAYYRGTGETDWTLLGTAPGGTGMDSIYLGAYIDDPAKAVDLFKFDAFIFNSGCPG